MANRKLGDAAFYALISLILFFFAANVSSQIILRGELVSVPDLKGKTLAEARAELAAKRTSMAILSRQFDTRIDKDRVISQDPGPGSRVKAKRTVNVVVSEGSERVPVPRLEGRSLEFAGQILKSSGLRRGRVAQIHTPQYAAGRIISQQPSSGDVAGRGALIDFLVSQGAWEPMYIMPDLIEKNAASVIRQLKNLGFQVAEIHYSYYPGWESGAIIKQAPVAGARILKRNQITLEVSK
jgi:serine/threonine-protein kinase